ncbi:hypothetical protein ES705_14603 [subsurface metagenome]
MISKRIFVLVFVVAFLTLMVGCGGTTPPIVENQAPEITSVPNLTATVGEDYTYKVKATDPDGDSLIYSLIINPTYMSVNQFTGVISWVPYYGQVGDNVVTVKVFDGELSDIQSFTIAVNQPPTASFTASPTSGIKPLEVYFNASGSSDPDGTIVSYTWNFKDGNMGSGEIVNHTFTSIGSYKVELIVADNKGATDSMTKCITVTESEPEPPGDVVITLDNLEQEYYEYLEKWSMVYAYYTIENNSNEVVYDYKIYFTVNCIDGNIYYDSWYENYTLSPGQSHSDYALIDTFGKQANSVKINELAINVYH